MSRGFCVLILAGLIAGTAWAETVELVTYYPTPGQGGNLHVNSLTVGADYNGTTPVDGVALISTGLWLGTGFDSDNPPPASEIFHIAGRDGAPSNVVFMPGVGAGSKIRVGIGTAAPAHALDVTGASGARVSANEQSGIYLNTPSLAAGNGGLALGFNRVYNDINFANTGYIQAESQGVAYRDLVLSPLGGNVGIGTDTPDQRLHVEGTVRIVDGTQAAGRVLTSDANGVASWQTVTATATLNTTNCKLGVKAHRTSTPQCGPGFYLKALVKSTNNNWDGYGSICCALDSSAGTSFNAVVDDCNANKSKYGQTGGPYIVTCPAKDP